MINSNLENTTGARGSPHIFFVIYYPIKLKDPDGKFIINNVANGIPSAKDYVDNYPRGVRSTIFHATSLFKDTQGSVAPYIVWQTNAKIELPNKLNAILKTVERNQSNKNFTASVKAKATELETGIYQIDLTVSYAYINPLSGEIITDSANGIIAYAAHGEVSQIAGFLPLQSAVNNIANEVIRTINVEVKVDE